LKGNLYNAFSRYREDLSHKQELKTGILTDSLQEEGDESIGHRHDLNVTKTTFVNLTQTGPFRTCRGPDLLAAF
jgi:hypothetical protein